MHMLLIYTAKKILNFKKIKDTSKKSVLGGKLVGGLIDGWQNTSSSTQTPCSCFSG